MTFQEYLTAKRTVDDRAINPRVLDEFATGLGDRSGHRPDSPLRILEAGTGTGTMIARLAAWDSLPDRVEYTGLDSDPQSIGVAREHAPEWVADAGYDINHTEDGFEASKDDEELGVTFEVGDVFARTTSVDAVIACAFCDLIELPAGLEKLLDLLEPGGLLYAPITYDGRTGFVPASPFDERIETLYHRHMADIRDEPGGPHAGQRLLEAATATNATVEAVGGSDWIIRPIEGEYPAEERVVIETLLETIHGAVREVPDAPLGRIDAWDERRRSELASAELLYLAHNLDVLLRRTTGDG